MPETKYLEELWIGIKADYAGLQAGLKASQNEIRAFSTNIAASSEQLRKFGTTTTLIAGAFAGLGYLLNKVFAQFEQSMANTFSVLGATKKEMDELTKYARLMGETTVFKASEAADAMYYLASAGYNAQQVMDSLRGTLQLAAATQYDLAETTRIVVGTLNAYNFEASEATRVSNVFGAIISGSQATMERLGYSMAYVAPIAAGLGIRFEELTAALGQLYNAGIQATTAGTALRQILSRLQAPTPEAIRALTKLGLTVADVNPQMHSLTEIIKAFEKAGAGAVDKGDELAAIFDIRSVAPFQVLLRGTSDALEVLETKITGTQKASDMAKTQIDTFKGSVKLLLSALQETAIQLGEAMQPILRTLVKILTDAAKVFNAIPTPIKAAGVAVVALAVGLGLIIGPLSIIIAKMPILIAQVAAFGTSMQISLGFVGLLAAGLTTLVFLMGNSIGKQAEQNRALSDGVTRLKEYNEGQILQKQKMSDVIGAYVKLAEKQNKTTKDIEEQKSAFNKIKELYPSLISSTDDYTTAVDKMKKALGETNTELKQLYEGKIKLRELELTIDVNKAKKDLRELNDTIKKTGTVANQELDTINGIGGVIQAQLGKGVDLANVLNNTFGVIGKTINTAGVFELENMSDALETILLNEDGVNKIVEDSGNLLKTVNDLELQRLEQLALIESKQNEMNGEITEQRKAQIESEKYADDYKLANLNKTIVALTSIQDIYNKTLETGQSQLQLQNDIVEKEAELEKLKKEGLAPPPTVPPVKSTVVELTDEEKKRIQELEKEIYELKKKSLESQLSILEKNRDDSLEADLRYLDAKYELEKMDTEFALKEQRQQLEGLNASQETMLELKQVEVQKKLELDELYLKQRQKTEEKWFAKNILMKENEFKYSLKLNEQDLADYRKVLDDKRIELENAGKKYTSEWADIVDRINATTQLIESPGVNKLKFEIEMFDQGKEGFQGEALDKYYEYLQGQLAITQEWSDEYVSILLEQERIKDAIRDRELDKNRLLFFSIRDLAIAAQAGISSGFDYMWNKYIIGAREAKNELDAIWLSIRNAVLKAIADIVQAEITKIFLKIIASVIGGIAGGPAGVAVATAALPVAATGAKVVKSGQMVVHKDEVVVPARIVRGNDVEYENALGDNNKPNTPTRTTGDMNLQIVLNNPSVDDKRYWESVIEDHIEPAFVKLKKRYES